MNGAPYIERLAVDMWVNGQFSQVEIARATHVAQCTIHRILKAYEVLNHPHALDGRRQRQIRIAKAASDIARASQKTGRPPIWPDCPAHMIADYRTLRTAGYRAAEARAMLERRAA